VAAKLVAGAYAADISPRNSQFLFGYPHVSRYSTGIHDPLLSSSMYLCDGSTEALIIANDLIYVSRETCRRVRGRVAEATSIPESHIMITATHTHSGPVTVDLLSSSGDSVVPPPDPEYIRFAEGQMVVSAIRAQRSARPARVGLALAKVLDNQTNRHEPRGTNDPDIPVLVVRDAVHDRYQACMVIYSVHPTALHERSTLVSADFPGAIRQYLQDTLLGHDCTFLYHTGPAGNQSPRHVISSNDFVAAEKLGGEIGEIIGAVVPAVQYSDHVPISVAQENVELIPRAMPTIAEATARVRQAAEELDRHRRVGSPPEVVRTAECDWFGAEETLTLAHAAQDGRLQSAYKACLPCEVQAIRLGPWVFVAWPGEVFVEYSLLVKKEHANVFIASLANGELQGYIVTEDAVLQNRYEAGNSIFDYRSGMHLVKATERLLAQLRGSGRDAMQTAPSSLPTLGSVMR